MEEDIMSIRLVPISDDNRDAVLALSVREDQPFVAPNDVSLRQADETNAEYPDVARPFAIYADDTLVGFCMFYFAPEVEEAEDRYGLWRFMIDKKEQSKGYGQAALQEAALVVILGGPVQGDLDFLDLPAVELFHILRRQQITVGYHGCGM